MTMSVAGGAAPGSVPVSVVRRHWLRTALRTALQLVFAYLLLLAVHAYLGQWTPEYVNGRDLWHFWASRMVVPMVMLGVFAAFARLVPSALLLAASFLFIGTLSAIKRESTGEPFQVSDLFLTGQGMHLLHYVSWDRWLIGALVVPAFVFYFWRLRFRWWSVPLALICISLLSTYRIEAVSKWIHANSWRIGVENLTFAQAESERMNGLGTHLYFSTAGLRLKTYAEWEVRQALDALYRPSPSPSTIGGQAPDLYIILGEAWWRDPNDQASPLDQLKEAGFRETTAVSPVYGGTTPNAEFEVLTGIPIKTFQSGIIPFQHYVAYFTDKSRALPRLLSQQGYTTAAYHNFTRRFWLRDQVYPLFGFKRFVSMEDMSLVIQKNDWPTDEGLYRYVLDRVGGEQPQLHYIVTVQTHGPFEKHDEDAEGHEGVHDYRARLDSAAKSLADFKAALDKKGRPYALVLFGDHLPGLRLHQWKNGMTSETDPRLRQVPLLVASNARLPEALVRTAGGRPLYCLMPLVLDWIGKPAKDRYLRHVAGRCSEQERPGLFPAEAVIQNQLFSQKPL